MCPHTCSTAAQCVNQIERSLITRIEVADLCPDFEGRAASEVRPKLHSRAEKLSLKSLDKSRAVGRISLDIPKFGRESLNIGRESLHIPRIGREKLDMGRECLDTDFCDPCPDFRDQIRSD